MLSLSDIFQSLRLEDGRPDLAARKAQLDDLRNHLSSTEIRRLRDQLNSVQMHTDIYIRLPADLLAIVVDHLELEDVLMGRCVSSTWRHLFSTPEICLHIAQKKLPATWANYLLALQSSTEDVAKVMFLNGFFNAAVNRIKKNGGCYDTVSTHSYGHDDAPLPVMSNNDWQYKSGRIGYKTHSYGFIAKDLSTGAVSRFFEEDREMVLDWLLLEQHVILSKSTRNTLCALPINSSINEASHTIQSPNRISRLSGQGQQVGIVTSSGDVFVWRIGGVMKQVETSQIYNRPTEITTSNTSIIFHPVAEQRFFVVYQTGNSDCRLKNENLNSVSLVVLEYGDWKLCAVYQSDPITSDYHRYRPSTISGGTIACLISESQVKEYGRWQDEPYPSNSQEADQRDGSNVQVPVEHIVLATFNIWNKRFEILTFRPPPAVWNGSKVNYARNAMFWNSQILLPVAHAESRGVQSAGNPLMLATHGLRGMGEAKQTTWYGCGDAPVTDSIVARGDDDTVVLFGKEAMTIWRFKQVA